MNAYFALMNSKRCKKAETCLVTIKTNVACLLSKYCFYGERERERVSERETERERERENNIAGHCSIRHSSF